MKQRVWLALATMVALALTGCSRSTSPLQATNGGGTAVAGNDAAQVAAVVQANPQFVDEDVWLSALPQSYGDATGLAAIRPLQFWRVITSVERTKDTEFGAPDSNGRPTMALVTLHRSLQGTFNILAGAVDPTDSTRSVVRKPLDDRWTRKLLLMRRHWPDGDGDHDGWRLVGTSGVEIHTQGGSTHIASLRIQAGPLDTTITDPLELHRLRRIVMVPPDAPVTLTATTGSATDVVLFYGHDMRRRFTNNGDGTFTFTFPSGEFPGLRHFGVDALSHGTLFDDAAAYDSNAWVFPFAVTFMGMAVDGR